MVQQISSKDNIPKQFSKNDINLNKQDTLKSLVRQRESQVTKKKSSSNFKSSVVRTKESNKDDKTYPTENRQKLALESIDLS